MFVTEQLELPLSWRKPRRIFVDSMSDLFYEGFSDEQIDQVFGVMALAPHHTFQVLTKRAARMRSYLSDDNVWPRIEVAARKLLYKRQKIRIGGKVLIGPLPNIWLGVSVENQDAADDRIPELLATPAALRFLSCEPLLGPLELKRFMQWSHRCPTCGPGVYAPEGRCSTCNAKAIECDGLDWLIAGCESGPGARSCDVQWLRSLRDQCASAGVPYFLKQAVLMLSLRPSGKQPLQFGEGSKGKGNVVELPYLDDVQHAAFPT